MALPLFQLEGRVAVVTGGGGVLGRAMAMGLAQAGAHVAITGNSPGGAEAARDSIQAAGLTADAFRMNVMDETSAQAAADEIAGKLGRIDILVNCVGGNMPGATTSPERSFFDIPSQQIQEVFALNLLGGAIVPCRTFGKHMTQNPNGGSIINISSMAGVLPLTRVVGYSAAKAAVDNFTRWLAVHLAKEYSPKLRVNAIAPGFFLTEQNRYLLKDDGGNLTLRGQTILDHTPMGRFGEPDDLVGVAVWLASDASRFVTGTVVAVDGGFSAFSGV